MLNRDNQARIATLLAKILATPNNLLGTHLKIAESVVDDYGAPTYLITDLDKTIIINILSSVVNLFKRGSMIFSDDPCRHGDNCIYDYVHRYLSQILNREERVSIIIYKKTSRGLEMELNDILITSDRMGCRFAHANRSTIDLNASLFGLKFYEAFKEQTRKIMDLISEDNPTHRIVYDIFCDSNSRPTDRFWDNLRALIYIRHAGHNDRITMDDASVISRISNLVNLSVILRPSRNAHGNIDIERISASVEASMGKKFEHYRRR